METLHYVGQRNDAPTELIETARVVSARARDLCLLSQAGAVCRGATN